MFGSAKGGGDLERIEFALHWCWKDKLETSRLSSPPMASNEDRSDQQQKKAFRSPGSIDLCEFCAGLDLGGATELGRSCEIRTVADPPQATLMEQHTTRSNRYSNHSHNDSSGLRGHTRDIKAKPSTIAY